MGVGEGSQAGEAPGMSSAPWRAAAGGVRGPGVFGDLQRPFKSIVFLQRVGLPTLLVSPVKRLRTVWLQLGWGGTQFHLSS